MTPLGFLLLVIAILAIPVCAYLMFIGGVLGVVTIINKWGRYLGPLLILIGIISIAAGSWAGFIPFIAGILVSLPAFLGW